MQNLDNTSGQGDGAPVPQEIDRWNWGAIFLNVIWGLGNKTYVAFFTLIPVINIFVLIALGYNGSKWAWRNKKWNSIEHFEIVQKRWAYTGFIVAIFYGYLFLNGLYKIFIQ